ncbi:hypothetical protein I316_03490 [Kwoniella heveanensis BCC8398]|uniref:Uncharacterized protein n=1 Tax=Kwoniella heveanensis BCC8398 TaxID=1296120 RepID=A0A1B9GVB5_9TREE|nr:hypothetical protein I316_03490 [Kwoniella heveanensis BCC8398]
MTSPRAPTETLQVLPPHIKQWQDWCSSFDLITIEPLHPVHHKILVILETVFSHVLLPVSENLYDKLMSRVYKRIILNERTMDSMLHGLLVPADAPEG